MAQLVSFPIMRLWARVVPRVKIFGIQLNPGPFNIKEHVIITIMANVGSGSAYAVSCGHEPSLCIRSLTKITLPLDGYYCRPKGVLQPEPFVRLRLDACHVYATGGSSSNFTVSHVLILPRRSASLLVVSRVASWCSRRP